MRIVEESAELFALDDRLDAGVLPNFAIEIVFDHAAGGARLVLPVAEHYPVDADAVAVIVIEQELLERAVLVRQHELVDVEYGDPFRFVLEMLAEVRVGATLNRITRRAHDGAVVAILGKDFANGNRAVVVVEIEMIDAV